MLDAEEPSGEESNDASGQTSGESLTSGDSTLEKLPKISRNHCG